MTQVQDIEPKFKGGIQVGETAYITRYATTGTGIREAVVTSAREANVASEGYGWRLEWLVWVVADRNHYYQGVDVFKTRREALDAAVKLAERELDSIDKSRERVRSFMIPWLAELGETS